MLNQFLRHVSVAFILRLTGMFLAFGVNVVLARVMGAAEYGVYTFAITILAFIVLFAKLGMDNAAIRFLPLGALRPLVFSSFNKA